MRLDNNVKCCGDKKPDSVFLHDDWFLLHEFSPFSSGLFRWSYFTLQALRISREARLPPSGARRGSGIRPALPPGDLLGFHRDRRLELRGCRTDPAQFTVLHFGICTVFTGGLIAQPEKG
jgi:hypothetical protein